MGKTRPNVLYILTDQWRAKATGYNGDPNAITPNIDRLAAESINFANAVATSPVCTPARAALLTGRFPTTTGMFMNDISLSPDEESIGKAFKAAGYDTAYVGKWHVDGHGRSSYIPPERRQGFDYWKVLECTHDYQNSEYYDNDDPNIKEWGGYDAFAQTEDAAAYVRQHAESDEPFFLTLSLGPPHFPHDNAPEEFQRNFSPAAVTFSPNVILDDPEAETFTRQEAAGYYAHIAALDRCVGDIVAVLEANGLVDDTILIFASDHGEMMGSHHLRPFTKQVFWDESCRVPFLLRYPPLTANCDNRTLMTPLGTVDIMPTLLSLCGIEIPAAVEGSDLSSCVRDQVELHDHAALYMSISPFSINFPDPGYRAVRTNRYTWARKTDGECHLYDALNDPYQLRNLADDPQAADIRKDLEEVLTRLLVQIDDPFREAGYYLAKWGYEVDEIGNVPYSQ
jgi:arylsulfatase A-like enzyme